jgi:beta-hydroxylase
MLLHFLAPKYLILYMFISSGMYVHFRGRVRHKFARQLTDHSMFMAPYNVLMYLFSAVRCQPILDIHQFPELARLRENWQTIRDEALHLFDEGYIRAAAKHNDLGFHSFFQTGWKRFYLKWYDESLPSAKALCPKTVELVESIPSVNGAMFALLPGGSRLGPHRDPFAGSLRYHLGLVTPNSPECSISVDGVRYYWRDGEDVIFDETYIHTAENKTDQTRIILFCDVERPLRNRIMRRVNRFMKRHVIKESGTQNLDHERVGVLNKIFAFVYQFRVMGKRLKQKNRTLYYVLKWALLGGILYAIFA